MVIFTVLFANFAESLAEGRGKAQASALKSNKTNSKARKLSEDGSISIVLSSTLRVGDIVVVSAGEIIPSDGEIISGIASIDESSITGESAPVVRESGGDFNSVIGGTKVLSDEITVRIMKNPGETFLDKMISLIEGAKRQKSPNEVAPFYITDWINCNFYICNNCIKTNGFLFEYRNFLHIFDCSFCLLDSNNNRWIIKCNWYFRNG